jgi:mutator protein MutT
MENIIKIGIGIMIKDENKILLGHRAKKRKDTGGIFEPDSWTFPGGKQEYNETVLEGAKREVKEETNLDIDDLEVYSVSDDIQPDRHFVTIQIIAKKYTGELKIMEPTKEDEWKWFDLDNLPENLYSPTKHFIEKYKNGIR